MIYTFINVKPTQDASSVDLYPSHVQYESRIPLLRLHNPLLLMKRNISLFYHCYPMCKVPIMSGLAESCDSNRGLMRSVLASHPIHRRIRWCVHKSL